MNLVGMNSFTHVPHAIVLESSEHMITKRMVFVLENIRLNVTASCFGAVYSPPCLLRSQNSGRLIIPRISKSTAGGRSFSI